MSDFLDSAHFLLESPLLFLFVIVPGVWHWYALKKPDSLALRIKWLKEDKFGSLYLLMLGNFLDFITKLIGDKDEFEASKERCRKNPSKICTVFGFNPWSAASYRVSLTLAFFYPIVAFTFFWVIGANGDLGGLAILSGSVDQIVRIKLLIGLPVTIFFIIWLVKGKSWYHQVGLVVLFLIIAYYVSSIDETVIFKDFLINILKDFLFLFSTIYLGGWSIAYIIKKSVIKAHREIFKVSVSVVSAFVIANAVAGIVGVAFAVAFASIYSSSIIGAFMFTFSFIFVSNNIITLIFTGALYIIIETLFKKYKMFVSTSFWLFITIIFLFLIYIWINSIGAALNYKDTIFILFFLILPLINAPLDWLSLGVTRGFLEAIRSGHHSAFEGFLYLFFDFLLATLFLFLVAFVTYEAIYLSGFIDVKQVMADIKDNPFAVNHYWIYFIFFSTLVPTFLHFLLASMALTLWLPHSCRHKIVKDMERSTDKIVIAWFYLTVTPLIFFLPFGVLFGGYKIIYTLSGWLFWFR